MTVGVRCAVALVAVSAAAASVAFAQPGQPTTLVVINLAGDQKAGAAKAAELRKSLKTHQTLDPIQAGPSAMALERELPESPELQAFREARVALAAAETELQSFRTKRALSRISEGERQTRSIAPSEAQRELLAQLAFARGLGELGEQNRGKAREAFELALRLDPDRPPPNPAAYDPVVVSLWKAAQKRNSARATTTLAVDPGSGDAAVFVDGVAVGEGVVTAELVPGDHEIAATLPGHTLAARRIVVGEGESTETLRLLRLPRPERAIEIRRRLLSSPSPQRWNADELAAAASEIVREEGADGALVIRGERSLEIAALRPDGRLLTRFRPIEGADSLFAFYLRVEPIDLRLRPGGEDEDKPWWKQGQPVAGFVGGIGVAALGAVLVVIFNNNSPNPRTATCCDARSLR